MPGPANRAARATSEAVEVVQLTNPIEDTTMNKLLAFLREEEGLTIVEYAVAGGLITAVVATAFTNLGAAVLVRINQLITALGGTVAG
jgi:pilus assembly protein Flp/PilA